jgi:hypothetical protein
MTDEEAKAKARAAENSRIARLQTEQRSRREERAKRLYEMWAHRTGFSLPFERVLASDREAWIELERATIDADDPSCRRCGGPLLVECRGACRES